MTAREVYEAVLIEMKRIGAPDLMLDEWNHYLNKSIFEICNENYRSIDINQESSDDVQVLKARTVLTGTALSLIGQPFNGATEALYRVNLPANYFHLLSCILTYSITKNYKCYDAGNKLKVPTRRLTSDMRANTLLNDWTKPQFKVPYHSVFSNANQILGNWKAAVDKYDPATVQAAINTVAGNTDGHNAYIDVDKDGKFDAGDVMSGPILEINYGSDNSIFTLVSVDLEYYKIPALVRLTMDELDSTEDNSQIMEYSHNVCLDIIKKCVQLLFLHSNDPKLQLYMAVNGMGVQSAQQPQQVQQQQGQA